LLTGGVVRRLATGGPILGAFSGSEFDEEAISLHEGDWLVLFTDGVTEAVNPQGEEFGDDRLISCLRADISEPELVLERILGGVREFCKQSEQGDDITVAITRFR
jgi:sigma-B regulation protein RsbU (phosphoserine phosphatase)